MFQMLSEVLCKNDLKWKAAELQYITSTNVEHFGDIDVCLPDGVGAKLLYKEELEVLGVILDRRGGTKCSMDARLTKAEGAYGSIIRFLKDKRIPVHERLRGWCRGPVGSALYGAGGWTLGKNNLREL